MNNNDVFVIHPYLKIRRMFKDSDLEEAYKLTEAIDLNPIFIKSVGLDKINSKTFLNSGFVKTIFDSKTGEILGAHMIGTEVTELINTFSLAIKLEATEEDIINTIFPHPTLSESIHESVLSAFDRSIHS